MTEEFATVSRPSSFDEKEIWKTGTDFDALVQKEIRDAVFDFMSSAVFAVDMSSAGRLQIRVMAAEPIDGTVLCLDFGALLKREWEESGEDPEWRDALKVACTEIVGD